ncbi:MAG TPA: hypothetical protein VGM27_22395, partial [Acidobacteriaceae bacterium]
PQAGSAAYITTSVRTTLWTIHIQLRDEFSVMKWLLAFDRPQMSRSVVGTLVNTVVRIFAP